MKAEKVKNTSKGTVHKVLTFSTFCTFLTPPSSMSATVSILSPFPYPLQKISALLNFFYSADLLYGWPLKALLK